MAKIKKPLNVLHRSTASEYKRLFLFEINTIDKLKIDVTEIKSWKIRDLNIRIICNPSPRIND